MAIEVQIRRVTKAGVDAKSLLPYIIKLRSMPSLSGMTRSVMTAAGGSSQKVCQASRPSAATITSKPASSSSLARARRAAG